ncbi:unnamed protein product [Caenorhabditis auriculariae]|uniref:Uncharacterized protein n=1 Tax=Caenorhabditis auriculariae TaxID=2777116 RepID=A0A8S1I0I1_9PELO|nr:unnamed protein product [Caenorhabditis auriculariae]
MNTPQNLQEGTPREKAQCLLYEEIRETDSIIRDLTRKILNSEELIKNIQLEKESDVKRLKEVETHYSVRLNRQREDMVDNIKGFRGPFFMHQFFSKSPKNQNPPSTDAEWIQRVLSLAENSLRQINQKMKELAKKRQIIDGEMQQRAQKFPNTSDLQTLRFHRVSEQKPASQFQHQTIHEGHSPTGGAPQPSQFNLPVRKLQPQIIDPEDKKRLDQVIEQQKIRKEVKEQTKDMSLAELMSKFGIQINNTTDSDDPSQNSPGEKPMNTSERTSTPEQETTTKPRGKTLPRFEFLRTYPSQFELKKEPETPRNTGFEGGYPSSQLFLNRVENSFSSSSGTMGISNRHEEVPKEDWTAKSIFEETKHRQSSRISRRNQMKVNQWIKIRKDNHYRRSQEIFEAETSRDNIQTSQIEDSDDKNEKIVQKPSKGHKELPKSTENSESIQGPSQSSNEEISYSPYRYELNESLERSQQSQETIQKDSPPLFSEVQKEKERVESALSSQKNLPDRVKELLKQAERKRDETRRQYEDEKVRREKIREEKRLQLEELERKDREKEEEAARELAELDKRIQDDERKSQKNSKKFGGDVKKRDWREKESEMNNNSESARKLAEFQENLVREKIQEGQNKEEEAARKGRRAEKEL